MKKIISLSLFVFGVFFAAQAQGGILSYQVDNSSATNAWSIEIYAGYPALNLTNINPQSFIKGQRDIKSVPVTWTAYKSNGCVATGSFSGAMPLTNATITCPVGATATAQYFVTGAMPSLYLYVRLN